MYKTILADPPWSERMLGKWQRRHKAPEKIVYPTLSLDEIKSMPVDDLADEGCHLWLWTTNSHLRAGFDVMEAWGFKYLAPVTWVKPSGMGAWFVHRTQTLLFGYKGKCVFPKARYKPTVLFANVERQHSRKPEESYRLIESVSPAPRIELFARRPRDGWDVWGNEVESDIQLEVGSR